MHTTMRRQDISETARPLRLRYRAGWQRRGTVRCIAALAVLAPVFAYAADRALLTLAPVPADGLVVSHVDLTATARWCGHETIGGLRVIDRVTDRPLSAQFVPDDGHGTSGTLVVKCDPARPASEVWLDFSAPAIAPDPAGAVTVSTRWAVVTHDPRAMGGMPATVAFAGASGPPVSLTWNDRLFTRELGQFALRYDRDARVRRLSAGPLCTVVRVEGRCVRADGTGIDPQPRAVYDWFYFHDSPRIYVQGTVRQDTPRTWGEAHFLELAFATNVFSAWAGGEPRQEGVFGAALATPRFPVWGAVFNDCGEIGMSAAGGLTVYNGGVRGPRYLHAHADAAWQGWSGTELRRDAWLWMVPRAAAAKAPAGPAGAVPAPVRANVSIESLRRRIDEAGAKRAASAGGARADWGWRGAVLRLLEERGLYREAADLPPGALPDGWMAVPAGDLRVLLERRSDGISLLNLVDAATGARLLGTDHAPVFDLALRREGSTDEVRLSSESGWGDVAVASGFLSDTLTLRWRKPAGEAALGDLEVTVRVRPDAERHRVSWSLETRGQAAPWSIWEVRFPQVVLAAPGSRSQLALPQASGVLKTVGAEPLARFRGDYPSGWTTLPIAALYDTDAGTGLYFGLHDPSGANKVFTADRADRREAVVHPSKGAMPPANAASTAVSLSWDIPAPDMGRAGNRFVFPGEAVWQLLRGDWFDAAVVYRDWARREARWYPRLTDEGRPDTPAWMRDLGVWTLMNGSPAECVPAVEAFAREIGVPVGLHWYNWHQIPFDNDYPHYFPVREGFAAGVKRLQDGGVSVMPYINGRLWDTRDQGTNDLEFTRRARPSAVKDFGGGPHTESYSSKESDGSKVVLSAMCPVTPLWQKTQLDIVSRLFGECGVRAVYMDQIAAASAARCFDPSHGHPLGGGSWWLERGYWPMLQAIRKAKPADRALTTECNAETYAHVFDGYLTWHWQYDGQIPLFSAIYGGAIQLFGRAYRDGPTRDLAFRMKAAQQLVYGEQPGWMHPNLVRQTANLAYLRDVVRVRWPLRRYFNAGEMARPPALTGDIPILSADWQWHGVWPVSTPAVMAGAWHRPSERRVILLFANASDQAITARVRCDLREAGLSGNALARRLWTPAGEAAAPPVPALIDESVTFPPLCVQAWEIGGSGPASEPKK